MPDEFTPQLKSPSTSRWQAFQVRLSMLLGVTLMPLFLVTAMVLLWGRGFSWVDLGLVIVMYLLTGFGITIGFHRYFSHKGFRCGRDAQFALWWLGCMACQGPPLWWTSKHRRHHAKCDTEEDPHTPVCFNPLYAWVGWTYLPGAEGLPLGLALGPEGDVDLAVVRRVRRVLSFCRWY